jgi:cyclophilin family peptidyl-prolyl cis-trans isomerase
LIQAVDVAKWLHEATPEITAELKKIYDRSVQEGWVDVGDSTKLAMTALGMRTNSLAKVSPKFEPIDWSLLESSPDTLLINMEKGQVYLYLLKEDAPLSCLNMIQLSKTGYFAHSVYHRVVPAFVAQSGDPTQTGWGGPGYAIRTEVSPQDYDEPGITGMASSGKDTEGSQWFITHVPTPHLDGHYTIWARVVRGMELINAAQLGDKIENIVLLKR